MAGILCATLILSSSQPYLAPVRALDYLIETLAAPDNLRLVIFSVLVGGLLKLIQDSGGFEAFALALRRWRSDYGKGTVYSLTWIFGASLILETWSNVLINGVTMGSLYERLGISRARLAYFVHTIAINVVALVLVNSWGAFYLALVTAQGVSDPLIGRNAGAIQPGTVRVAKEIVPGRHRAVEGIERVAPGGNRRRCYGFRCILRPRCRRAQQQHPYRDSADRAREYAQWHVHGSMYQ